MRRPADTNTYGPGQVLDFVAHAALFHPEKVVVDADDARQLRAAQRRLLGRRPDLRHLVASRVDQGRHRVSPGQHRRAPRARPVHRRGSRRTGGGNRAGPGDPDDDPEPAGGRHSHALTAGAAP
jgi:hypothetical protein